MGHNIYFIHNKLLHVSLNVVNKNSFLQWSFSFKHDMQLHHTGAECNSYNNIIDHLRFAYHKFSPYMPDFIWADPIPTYEWPIIDVL